MNAATIATIRTQLLAATDRAIAAADKTYAMVYYQAAVRHLSSLGTKATSADKRAVRTCERAFAACGWL